MFLNDLKYSSRQGPAASEFTSIFSIHLAKILKKERKKRSIEKRRNYRLYQRNTLLVKTNPGRSLFSLLGRVVYRLWSISWTKLWLVPQNTEVCRAPYFFFFFWFHLFCYHLSRHLSSTFHQSSDTNISTHFRPNVDYGPKRQRPADITLAILFIFFEYEIGGHWQRINFSPSALSPVETGKSVLYFAVCPLIIIVYKNSTNRKPQLIWIKKTWWGTFRFYRNSCRREVRLD